MKTGLCVGGPLDGETRTAHGRMLVVPMRIPVSAAAYPMSPVTRDTQEYEYRKAEYVYEELRFD
jgi:hypothetical protein